MVSVMCRRIISTFIVPEMSFAEAGVHKRKTFPLTLQKSSLAAINSYRAICDDNHINAVVVYRFRSLIEQILLLVASLFKLKTTEMFN